MVIRLAVAVSLLPLLGIAPAHALSFNISGASQQDFHSVAQDVTAALDYKVLGPSAPTGLLGISVDAFGSYASTRDSGAWQRLTGSSVDAIGIAGVRADKGLPLGFDVGVFYAAVPDSSAAVYGGELRYAILAGTFATPALAVRATYTRASNTGDFAYQSYGADISASQDLVFLTPYAGLGYVVSNTRADAQFGLPNQDLDRPKGFAGLRFKLLLIEATAEYERLGPSNVYSLSGGLSF